MLVLNLKLSSSFKLNDVHCWDRYTAPLSIVIKTGFFASNPTNSIGLTRSSVHLEKGLKPKLMIPNLRGKYFAQH